MLKKIIYKILIIFSLSSGDIQHSEFAKSFRYNGILFLVVRKLLYKSYEYSVVSHCDNSEYYYNCCCCG